MDESKQSDIGRLFEELCRLSAFLRTEDGCRWDRAQTLHTLTPYLMEEASEAIEAVERGEMDRLSEELGDVLYLVVFMADAASSAGAFAISDVLRGIRDKLHRRHPHIFGARVDMTADQVKSQWEVIKKGEKGGRSILKEYPASLPGLLQAYRIQEKAAAVGFDWDRVEQVADKVEEELNEVREALSQGQEPSSRELGDLLFAVVNLCRFAGADPERAVRGSVDKFRRRFRFIEGELEKRGTSPDSSSLEEMDKLWDEAKRRGL
jgi:tetrapyrrole methylase family protein/MazG family protein